MVHMANQIAQFFASYPHEECVAGVANHLQKFWEKRMRQQLHEYISQGGAGLDPVVIEAEKRLTTAPGNVAQPNTVKLH